MPAWSANGADFVLANGETYPLGWDEERGAWRPDPNRRVWDSGKRCLPGGEDEYWCEASIFRGGKAAAGRHLDGQVWHEFPELPAVMQAAGVHAMAYALNRNG